MGNGVGLYGIEDDAVGQQEKNGKQHAHPAHAESPGHIPGRATAKVPAGVALFIKLREGTFGETAGHAEQRRDPHPENGAGATCGDGQRHACHIAAAHARRKAHTERLKRG